MSQRYAVVLAAGKGTRMKSELYKVLHPIAGKPMVEHVVDQLESCSVDDTVTIVGHGAEKVQDLLGDRVSYAVQEEQLGTGHAVMQAGKVLEGKSGTTLVVCGDTPLLTAETFADLMAHHEQTGAKATVLTAVTEEPDGYGRVLRDADGQVEKIVEHKDASEKERRVKEINSATYVFDNEALFTSLKNVGNDNVQGEYYLPDVIEILQREGETVSAFTAADFHETMGVNDRVALSEAEKWMKRRINEYWMRQGVTMTDPEQTYISRDAVIGPDTVLEPGTVLRGGTIIGSACRIGPHTELTESRVGDRTLVKQSVASMSDIGSDVKIGPFAHLRPETALDDGVRVGNFVELKKVSMGKNSKASHLSYLGDAEIGDAVNVGCGSITVNYDGKNKYLTKIEDGAFVGCNSNLIAPVSIGTGAYIAAGSTITDDVPGESLAIARSRQTTKEGYLKNDAAKN
ncbi:bifunctional UDP-N-acetylglucosamine diphosphorylase/glucosamine-1-phosphate N-acetyltransferase GlmU [Salisediminibacterium halotolerans]|uniref:bifunctional UDP-N-acetylglucosamine diphosphorylase/glucosamine-1-phosphate N-acetyltransferase GlmU n=1 Tax=Salisediminibacterium halotolerans TaxID=517425 RepID=UPI000EB56DEF|nr:bifunctional UDP-N-acetylglucosamine diphosphorylase/glucosamine-1-phosphate N-acetyltransferase GlmU [Salisediminibacterium halotolerans]RLJ80954.1 bifunctional UDP-N-acetylglucosamine pyrophosphorylase/glucosamine-1-phosphate N-acetyltransferase [Actinophytocola xinjiangensis]RPE83641.1 bifunctional UDP-N-acetylglucosamine pyrophosphorylase/glucosamine-1-phosphate N-acetyltransferase [Salisediminibacterium halotolerans]TWG37879.1 bifunctional UDP-N-acetylglucosamine pyrophosphorylase/glucos